MMKYQKHTIHHAKYIKVIIKNCLIPHYIHLLCTKYYKNSTFFPELKKVFKEDFGIKIQEGSVLKY